VRGILTFGTPHDGAELAESSVGLEALAYLMLGSSTSLWNALPNWLTYLGHLERQGRLGHIDGVRDLAPVGNGYSTFLSELMDDECKIGRLRPPIFAVGGDVTRGSPFLSSEGQFANRYMKALITGHIGSEFHDLVVRCNSSAPTWIAKSRRRLMSCDHLSYFQSTHPNDYAAPLKALLDWMGWSKIAERQQIRKPSQESALV
jgi:hypothetical protein